MNKAKILVIDDEPIIRIYLQEILQKENYQVTTVESGSKGINEIKENFFNIVVVDISMPGMTGIEFLKKARKIRPQTSYNLMTGQANLNSAIKAFQFGADGYFAKPLEIELMLHRFTEICEKQKMHSDLSNAYETLKKSQSQIIQQEKMASIGQLAAGVAHEINNPVGFINSNLSTLNNYTKKLQTYIKTLENTLPDSTTNEIRSEIESTKKSLKIDYILNDMPELIAESQDGTDRVKKIVQNLKSFSRIDENEQTEADINECLESTINIIWNELKYKATIIKEYEDIPPTLCYPQQLNQVFMNLMINAVHAMEKQGEIIIRSSCALNSISVSITDNGCGIPEKNLKHIFEPFFTTKEAGKGTGLGMSIAYDIIKKHHGSIEVESEVDKGTTFTVVLPVIKKPPK